MQDFKSKKYERDWLRKEDEINRWLPMCRAPIYLEGKPANSSNWVWRWDLPKPCSQSKKHGNKNTAWWEGWGISLWEWWIGLCMVVKIHQYLVALHNRVSTLGSLCELWWWKPILLKVSTYFKSLDKTPPSTSAVFSTWAWYLDLVFHWEQ